jgi:hypothetical protein
VWETPLPSFRHRRASHEGSPLLLNRPLLGDLVDNLLVREGLPAFDMGRGLTRKAQVSGARRRLATPRMSPGAIEHRCRT